jgi:hypothetical protein
MNHDILKGMGPAQRPGQEQWGKLTDDEIDEPDGRRDQWSARQERHGIARDQTARDRELAHQHRQSVNNC